MAEFFKLNAQITDDKVIKREERIVADTLTFADGDTVTVQTTSKAPSQKLKFFLDVMRFYDDTTDPITDRYYRVGHYFELEPTETAQHFFSLGWIWFSYECAKTGDGQYTITLKPNDPRYSFFISSVVMQDSFYNASSGWLNPDNPQNIIDLIQTEEMKGAERMDLAYAHFKINNISATENPYLKYVHLYSDDFCEFGYVKPAAASMQFLVFPKNIQAIKPTDETALFPYKGSGAMMIELPLASATIALAGATVQQLNEPHDISALNPTWLEVPTGIGFSFLMVAGGVKFRYYWKALDGYTYGIEVFGNVYNIAATAAADLSVLYLGRNPTGYSPVPLT